MHQVMCFICLFTCKDTVRSNTSQPYIQVQPLKMIFECTSLLSFYDYVVLTLKAKKNFPPISTLKNTP